MFENAYNNIWRGQPILLTGLKLEFRREVTVLGRTENFLSFSTSSVEQRQDQLGLFKILVILNPTGYMLTPSGFSFILLGHIP